MDESWEGLDGDGWGWVRSGWLDGWGGFYGMVETGLGRDVEEIGGSWESDVVGRQKEGDRMIRDDCRYDKAGRRADGVIPPFMGKIRHLPMERKPISNQEVLNLSLGRRNFPLVHSFGDKIRITKKRRI